MLLHLVQADTGLDGQILKSVVSLAIVCQFLCIVAVTSLPMSKKEVIWREFLLMSVVFVRISYCDCDSRHFVCF